MDAAVEEYIKVHNKSQIVGLFLAVVLGPLGLFYSNWIIALILCVIAITSFSTIIGPLVCWALSIIFTFGTVHTHNAKVKATANLIHVKNN